MSGFQLFSFVSVLLAGIAGGYYPLTRREVGRREGLPKCQAFAAGVFLALSLSMMLPASLDQLSKALPDVEFPLASLGTIVSFLTLLAIGHWSAWRDTPAEDDEALSSASTPIIMTIMIAIPSFLMGAAIGVSESAAGAMILLAILAHKSSAGFTVALAMIRSRLSHLQTLFLFGLFVISTPLGILFGADIQQVLNAQTLLIFKGVVFSLASGVFLFMATLHELRHAPLIVDCCSRLGFALMVCGVLLTVFVRLIIGLAHTGQLHPS